MNFSEKLKSARAAKGMTQKDLAKASGISERSIQSYELGVRSPRNEESYRKLAQALDLPADVLLDDNAAFVLQAGRQYGTRGRRQAEEVVRAFRIAAAGGELDDDDLDFIKEAMLQTYEDAKAYNRRFVNKRFLDAADSDE